MPQVPRSGHRLLLQLHITGRCNLRCKHCYIDERGQDALSLQDIKDLIDDFCLLVKRYNAQKGLHSPGQINLTGGEPFLREDVMEILRYIRRKDCLNFAILTNGSLITAESARELQRLRPLFVQVSLDGRRRTHDALRAPGNFDATLRACDLLHAAGIRTLVSFTANRMNMKDYPAVLRACRKHRVDKLWTDRLVPIGTGGEMAHLTPDAETYCRYVQSIRRKQKSPLARCYPTEVALTRSLQFLDAQGECCGASYICSAGDSLIVVDEHGDIYPCRRLPIRLGNIREQKLSEVYQTSEILAQIRMRETPEECANCHHLEKCFGGSRCVAYAMTGRLDARDPACWVQIARENGGKQREP